MCFELSHHNADCCDGNHVRATITRAVPAFNETSLIGSIRDHLVPDQIKTLVRNTELQELLKQEEAYHHLIGCLVRMNKSGRSRALRDPSNTLAGVAVMDSISDNFDYLFLHLRENPSLYNRHRGRPVATAQSTRPRGGRK
jgi:hypothetical protein